MKNTVFAIFAATALFTTANNALSQEVASIELTKEEIVAENLASTMEAFAEICAMQDTIILSKDAIAACDGNEKKMPTPIKKGTRFAKARTGAEFNTLIANIAVFR